MQNCNAKITGGKLAFVTLNVGLRRKDAAKIAGKLDQSRRKIFPILAISELQVWIIF